MGTTKTDHPRKEILALAMDGWRFRTKTRKNTLYISARKGENEKSLGRYREEYWAMIMDVVKSLNNKQEPANVLEIKSEKISDPLETVVKKIEHNMRLHLFMQCKYKDKDDFCGHWLLMDLPKHERQLSKMDHEWLFKKVKDLDGKTQCWTFRTTVGLCSSCPYFTELEYDTSQFPHVSGSPRRLMPFYIK